METSWSKGCRREVGFRFENGVGWSGVQQVGGGGAEPEEGEARETRKQGGKQVEKCTGKGGVPETCAGRTV